MQLGVSNILDPDQARHTVGPDLEPNCLQRLSTGHKSHLVLSISQQKVKHACFHLFIWIIKQGPL